MLVCITMQSHWRGNRHMILRRNSRANCIPMVKVGVYVMARRYCHWCSADFEANEECTCGEYVVENKKLEARVTRHNKKVENKIRDKKETVTYLRKRHVTARTLEYGLITAVICVALYYGVIWTLV